MDFCFQQNKENIILQLSDAVYGDFRVSLPKKIVDQNSKDVLISHIIEKLEWALSEHHLTELLNGLKKKKWHIHDNDIIDKSIIYICSL